MANILSKIVIEWQRRRATMLLNDYWKKQLSTEELHLPVRVHGVFQGQDADWAGPVAAVEFENGSMAEVTLDRLVFEEEEE